MGKNYFSDEKVKEIQQNPYVKNVSNKAITYTDDLRLYLLKNIVKVILLQ